MRRNPFSLFGAMFRHPVRRTTPVLMYHHIRHAEPTDKLSVSPQSFARQMRGLKVRGYRAVSILDLAKNFEKGIFWSPRTFALTFDDGFLNFDEHAAPILTDLGFSATVFLITSKVGQPGYLDWQRVRKLKNRGFEFGSHTVTHRSLVRLDDTQLEREIKESKEVIWRHIGHKPALFSYPLGEFDERVKRIVQESGYHAACATNPRHDTREGDRFSLKRIKISPTSDRSWVFRIETSGYYQWFKEVRRQ